MEDTVRLLIVSAVLGYVIFTALALVVRGLYALFCTAHDALADLIWKDYEE